MYVREPFNIPCDGKIKDARYPRDGGLVLAKIEKKIWGQKKTGADVA